MRSFLTGWFALALAAGCAAQEWQLGASGGFGVYRNVTVSGNGQDAKAGFKPGPLVGAFATQDLYEHLTGAIRYELQFNDLKVSAGGTETTFSGRSHAIHYDLMYMAGKREAPLRPFVAGGAGVKIYEGTGTEHASQPLMQFAALIHARQVKPLIAVGAGVRAKLGARAFLYLQAYDYLTPFPTHVVVPVPPSKLSGWLHDFVPMVSFGYRF